MDVRKLSVEEKAALNPQDYRLMVRRGEWPTDVDPEYCCAGYTWHAVNIIPREYAYEYLLFCTRNPRGLFVSEVCEPGSPHPMLLAPDADLRTDCGKYRVYQDGEVIDEPTDILKYWRDDLIAFLLPCSYSFEGVLRQNNVKFRTMGTFTTNLHAIPAGRFKCDNIIVTVRLFKTSRDAVRAIQITSRLPVAHGSPICIGDPARIGIKDIFHGDIWNFLPPDAPPQEPNEVCLTWMCACTPENAIKAAKPSLAIVHHPGYVFVSDRLTEEFAYTEELGSNLV